jgi:chromosomal replication initiation ATPase DnaA
MLGLISFPNFAGADRSRQRMSADDIARLIVTLTAREFCVDSNTLRGRTRGSPRAAFARQVAMYVAHVTFALDFAAIGRVFRRDRTTVAHACRVVENRRDDRAFDARLGTLESLCISACRGDAQ